MREKPYPLFCFAEGVIPAASIWTGSRLWVDAFRAAGLGRGDRIVVALPPSAAWLQVVVAAIWEGLTLALAPPPKSTIEMDVLSQAVDARAAVVETGDENQFVADWCAGPISTPTRLRQTVHPPTPDVRFLLRTSGTESGDGRWIALSEDNVLSVVASHSSRLGLMESSSRVLSALPWSHAFGLVIDLFPALFAGAEIHRDPAGGRDASGLLDAYASAGITDFSAVPLTIKRLIASEEGKVFLRSLRGGVIGGAPIDESLSEFLRTTFLRVGYGQTEASPGVALGERSVFPRAYYLGQSLACETRTGENDSLEFRGPNACVGTWSPTSGFAPLIPDRWHDTGDLVEIAANGDLFFRGRTDSAFKLANGRRIEPESLERDLRCVLPEAEHLVLFSDDGETLTVASDVTLPREILPAALGSLSKLLRRVLHVPGEVFVYTPKGTLRRNATCAAIQSHVLQSPHANIPR